jgi:hypothetical protein
MLFNVDEKSKQKQKLHEELKQLKCIYEIGNKIFDLRWKRHDLLWEELELGQQMDSLRWSPTFHSECRINKGLSYRGSTIDH